MKIYRLERRGIGPYMGKSDPRLFWLNTNKIKLKRARHIQHQCTFKPENQFSKHVKATQKGEYLFGAKTRDLLKAYFKFNLQPYFRAGYKIKVYEVPDNKVIDMGYEVAFPVKYHKLKSKNRLKKALSKR